MLGEYKDSHECYRKAAGMFKKQKDTFGFAYCNCGMGSAARMSFKPEVSVEYYRIAVKNYRKITDEINIAFVLWGYANTLLTAGRLKEAEKLHR